MAEFPDDLNWEYVLILPICGESPDLITQVLHHNKHQSVLVVVLVNFPVGHEKSNQWQSENKQWMASQIAGFSNSVDISDQHKLFINHQTLNCDVLLLNFNSNGFPANKGVGLARRIAADTALALINKKTINHSWVFSTDADVVLPESYFESIHQAPSAAVAMSLDFQHVADTENQQHLQQQYDFKMRYYQQGVRYIGVAYDYIPLGSTLIVHAQAYAQVRGFPCKSGGEDFYILNKLAKLGQIHQPKNPIVVIKSRFSDRVPFGTGPAVQQIQQLQLQGQEPTYYHPKIYIILKIWYSALLDYFNTRELPPDDFGLNNNWQIEQVLNKAIPQIKTEQRMHQFIHEWFDAFRVLKSVHFLRQQIQSMPMNEILNDESYLLITKDSTSGS